MKRRTPQEKKALSYERDRRNRYGEAPHAARKAIPLNKARRNRSNRRRENQPLRYLGPAPDEPLADEFESRMFRRAPRVWKKTPDVPLGEVVAGKVEERAVLQESGGRLALLSVYVTDPETGKLIPVTPFARTPR
ncbi:MAG TPA: hypothetical protein VF668_06950 [Pyrinomonadaceae bacterium]|jgi:hypothetical protein